MLNSHLIQLRLDWLYISVIIQEAVCHDKRFLLMHNRTQFIQRHRHAALLKVDFFRRSEPKHVFSPLRNGLNI